MAYLVQSRSVCLLGNIDHSKQPKQPQPAVCVAALSISGSSAGATVSGNMDQPVFESSSEEVWQYFGSAFTAAVSCKDSGGGHHIASRHVVPQEEPREKLRGAAGTACMALVWSEVCLKAFMAFALM